MNWYAVTLTGRVERYDVNKTIHLAISSRCDWTAEKLLPALTDLAAKDDPGMTDLRITEIAEMPEPPQRRDIPDKYFASVDLDGALGI